MRSPPSSLALFTFPLGGSAAIAPRSLPDGPNSSPVLPCSHRQFKETVLKFTQEAIAPHTPAAMEAVGESDATVQGHDGGEANPMQEYVSLRDLIQQGVDGNNRKK